MLLIAVVVGVECLSSYRERTRRDEEFAAWMAAEQPDTCWRGDNVYQIPDYNDSGRLIGYGRQLISNTAYYFGPKGLVARTTNGMNCQNCHLEAGTRPFGNNFGKVYSTYPQYRARNDGIQTIYGRVNDCFERSLNGKALDSNCREMRAIYAYMRWLGEGIPKGVVRGGTGLIKLPFMDSASNPGTGRQVYRTKCQSCHGDKGQGQPAIGNFGFTYPPLWGPYSYNDGSGLYRLSTFAGYIKSNMPFGTDYHQPVLTDEEAWDVAAFVNSQSRPHKDQREDWKNIAAKPVDLPFGPYADSFSERQHKYGPFKPIQTSKKQNRS